MWRPKILLATSALFLLGGCAIVDALDSVAGLFRSTDAVAGVIKETNHLLEHAAIFAAGMTTSGGGLFGFLKIRQKLNGKKKDCVAETCK